MTAMLLSVTHLAQPVIAEDAKQVLPLFTKLVPNGVAGHGDVIFESNDLGLGSIGWHHRTDPVAGLLWRCAIFHEIRHHDDAVALLALQVSGLACAHLICCGPCGL